MTRGGKGYVEKALRGMALPFYERLGRRTFVDLALWGAPENGLNEKDVKGLSDQFSIEYRERGGEARDTI